MSLVSISIPKEGSKCGETRKSLICIRSRCQGPPNVPCHLYEGEDEHVVHSIVVTGLLKYLDLSWADDLAEPPEATHVGGLRNNGTEAERATTQVCDHHYTNYKAKS